MAKKAKAVALTAQQQSELQGQLAGIDWNTIDWKKLGNFLRMLLDLWLAQQPKQATVGDHTDHEACCIAALQAALESAAVSAHCYATCHDHEPH